MSPLRSKADMLGFILKSVATNPRLLGDCMPLGEVLSR